MYICVHYVLYNGLDGPGRLNEPQSRSITRRRRVFEWLQKIADTYDMYVYMLISYKTARDGIVIILYALSVDRTRGDVHNELPTATI